LAVLFLLVVTTPVWASASVSRLVVDVLVLVAVAQLWSYLAGTAGLVTLGAHGFAGVGAYALWTLSERGGINPVVAVAGAGVVALLVAAVIGPLVLRLAAVPAALATWVVAAVCTEVVTRTGQVGGGEPRRVIQPVVDLGSSRDGMASWLAVVLGVGVVVLVYGHRRSRYGLALVAFADDPAVASGLDLPVAGARRTAWLVAAAAAGMAGAVAHFRTGEVSPSAFDPAVWTYPAVAVAGIGGLSTVEGPFVGAVLYVLLHEAISGHDQAFAVVMAAAGVVGLVVGPDGWWGWARRALPFEPLPVRRRPSRRVTGR
jgi:branched-chain amino acid transport system permease protein